MLKDLFYRCLDFAEPLKNKVEKSRATVFSWVKNPQNIKNALLRHKDIAVKAVLPLLIIGLALHSCNSLQKETKYNVKEIFALSDEVRNSYASKPGYWGLSTSSLIKENVLSDRFVRNGKIFIAPSAEVLIGEGKNGDMVLPGATTFDIILRDLNKAQCIAYAEQKLSEDELVKLLSISIISTLGKQTFEWGGKYPLPVEKYASKDFCADNGNIIIWSMK